MEGHAVGAEQRRGEEGQFCSSIDAMNWLKGTSTGKPLVVTPKSKASRLSLQHYVLLLGPRKGLFLEGKQIAGVYTPSKLRGAGVDMDDRCFVSGLW